MPDHAVIIGISRYPGLTNLQGPGNDLAAFEQWLLDPAGGGLDDANIHRTGTHLFAANPDRPHMQDIKDVFWPITEQANATGAALGDRLYIYLAGHGVAPEANDAALLAANTTAYHRDTAMSAIRYANYIGGRGVFREIFAIADCCRDDRSDLEWNGFPYTIRNCGPAARRLDAFAVRFPSKAREGELGGEPRGFFTAALIDALRFGRREPEGLTPKGLKAHMLNFVTAARLHTGATIDEPDVNGAADFVVSTKPAQDTVAVTLEFAAPDPTHAVEVTGADGFSISRTGTTTSWELALVPGFYQVLIPARGVAMPFFAFSLVGERHHVA